MPTASSATLLISSTVPFGVEQADELDHRVQRDAREFLQAVYAAGSVARISVPRTMSRRSALSRDIRSGISNHPQVLSTERGAQAIGSRLDSVRPGHYPSIFSISAKRPGEADEIRLG